MADLVTVFETSDPVALALARSVLEQAGVPFVVRGEALQDLFGAGRMGTGFNPFVGAITVQVDATCAEEARRMLADLTVDSPGSTGAA